MKTIARRAVLVAGVAVLLTSCFKLDMNLTVSTENTVDGTMILGLDKDLVEILGDEAERFFDQGEGLPTETEGVTEEPYEDEDFVGRRYRLDGVPLSELNEDAAEGESLRIDREGDRFVVSGVLDLSEGGGGEIPPGMLEGIAGQADLRIALTFPGEVISTNGQVTGNTVEWAPRFGERTELQAVAEATPGGGRVPLALVGAGILVLAVVAAGAFVLAKRREGGPPVPRQPAPAGEGAPDGPDPESGED